MIMDVEREKIELAHGMRCLSIQFTLGELPRAAYQQLVTRLLARYEQIPPGRALAWDETEEAAEPYSP